MTSRLFRLWQPNTINMYLGVSFLIYLLKKSRNVHHTKYHKMPAKKQNITDVFMNSSWKVVPHGSLYGVVTVVSMKRINRSIY